MTHSLARCIRRAAIFGVTAAALCTGLAAHAQKVRLATSAGDIVIELDAGKAPKTVDNFVRYVKDGHYNGTVFHRVIPSFMIQGGDPMGNGMGGPGYKFEDETKGSSHRFDKPGKLAMANAGPNTNGSQFFITVAPTEWLTGKHTIFGEVVEGYDVVEKISNVPRGGNDRPKKDVTVQSVKIERV
jgi:peptidyl-prolyl cis-trans isomerase A (cyclophilin A)